MFVEFILPYQLPVLERFGLNCYSCSELIEVRWEHVKKIPKLCRVSSSPWANKLKIAEQLGSDYIMFGKPSPTPLSVAVMDEDVASKDLQKTRKSAKGFVIELVM